MLKTENSGRQSRTREEEEKGYQHRFGKIVKQRKNGFQLCLQANIIATERSAESHNCDVVKSWGEKARSFHGQMRTDTILYETKD